MSYKLLFSPELVTEGDPTSDVLLVPVIVAEDGRTFALKKTVKTAKQAFMFNAGFALVQFIEDAGGFEGVKAILEARDEATAIERADTLTQQEEDDLLDAMDDGPLAPTVEDGLFGDEKS